jgi:hypothetical protein
MTRIHSLHRGVALLALGTILAGTPLGLSFDAQGAAFGIAPAFAKDGDDDRGGDDNSGRGGGDDRGGSDDRGGGDDRGGSDDRGGDDNGGRGGDDDRDDDRGGRGGDDDRGRGGGDDRRGRGGDDGPGDDRGRRGGDVPSQVSRAAVGPAGGGALQVVKVERSGGSVEIIYSNGTKEEIENGRYELKNAAGRTVVQRPATDRDLARINGNLRNSGLLPGRNGAVPRLPVNSQAASIEVGRNAIEVRYTTGWKEEVSAGRYELKDPNNNTVVERRATTADRRRLLALAGG